MPTDADNPEAAPVFEGEVKRWNEILALLTRNCPLIAAVLNDSKAYIKGDYLLIDAPNSQFKSLIRQEGGRYKQSIREAAEQVLGVTYKLGPYTKPQEPQESDPLTALANKLKNLEIN